MYRALSRCAFLLASLAFLSACGGGGGGDASGGSTSTTFSLGGVVTGLSGTITLNNGGSTRTLSSNGSFVFSLPIADGSSYNVTIATQPTDQVCVLAQGTGTVSGTNVTSVQISCTTNTYTIGGTVSGLTGSVLLQNNNTQDLTVSANGSFTFAPALTAGTGYSVAVQTQPAGQTCTVSNGSGVATGGNTTNVSVVCVVNTVTYTIGGNISGLSGTVVLQNNGGNNLSVSANGSFQFTTALNTGSAYQISVLTQPPGENCAVTNGSGTANGNITSVSITCSAQSYTIGGTISGLAGSLVLQNNGSNNLTRTANGSFTFSTPIEHNNAYDVTVLSQPPGRTCTIANGSGNVAGANVTSIAITCVPVTYTIGFTVSGLTSGPIVLSNNGNNNSVSADGSYVFSTRISSGSTYNVAIVTQPTGQNCTVLNGSGTVSATNITSVQVMCGFLVTVSSSKPRELTFNWAPVAGATYYKLFKNANGHSGFSQLGSNLATTTATDVIPVHIHDWINASYLVEACNTDGCTASAPVFTTSAMLQAIGYFKASNTGASDSFGYDVAISADGSTLAVGAYGEGSAATGTGGDESNNAATNAGAVYVFTRNGANWSQQAYIKASNAGAADFFGAAVTMSDNGNVLAVAAPGEASNATGINGNQADNSKANAGAVYVFTRSGSVWSQQAYLKASNTDADDYFGIALAISGDGATLAAGSPYEDSSATAIDGDQSSNAASYSGVVYIFTESGGNWNQQAYIKASNCGEADIFGYSLALSTDGDTLAAGAPGEDGSSSGINGENNNSASASGALYVFTRSANTWSQQAYIKESNTGADDAFGSAVAVSGDGNTLAAGAPGEQSAAVGIGGNQLNEALVGAGAAYVFKRTLNVWSQNAYIKASNTNAFDAFGTQLALSADGDTLAISAPFEDSDATGSNGNQSLETAGYAGAVYVFRYRGSVWSQNTYLKASNSGSGDKFGSAIALALDGEILAVSAPNEAGAATGIGGNAASNGAVNAGAVYLY